MSTDTTAAQPATPPTGDGLPARPQFESTEGLMPTPGYLVSHLQQQVTMLGAQLALTNNLLAEWRAYATALEAKLTPAAPAPGPAPEPAVPVPAVPVPLPPVASEWTPRDGG